MADALANKVASNLESVAKTGNSLHTENLFSIF